MNNDQISANDKHSFKQELKLFDSTMIVIGSMIGSGIFIVSADIARTVGSPGLRPEDNIYTSGKHTIL
jgi:APA family basic amino acid/polyamine antiporter